MLRSGVEAEEGVGREALRLAFAGHALGHSAERWLLSSEDHQRAALTWEEEALRGAVRIAGVESTSNRLERHGTEGNEHRTRLEVEAEEAGERGALRTRALEGVIAGLREGLRGADEARVGLADSLQRATERIGESSRTGVVQGEEHSRRVVEQEERETRNAMQTVHWAARKTQAMSERAVKGMDEAERGHRGLVEREEEAERLRTAMAFVTQCAEGRGKEEVRLLGAVEESQRRVLEGEACLAWREAQLQ
eukprot:Sspe_Gene.18852::Locus_6816_Transcript_1_1_Confidence_1.000_Length_752::g.18852::m.18852